MWSKLLQSLSSHADKVASLLDVGYILGNCSTVSGCTWFGRLLTYAGSVNPAAMTREKLACCTECQCQHEIPLPGKGELLINGNAGSRFALACLQK